MFFTGSVAFSYLSLPYVKEAAVIIKEAASINNLAEIGHELGIPGIEAPVMKTGPINESNKGYIRKLDDDMKNLMADIDHCTFPKRTVSIAAHAAIGSSPFWNVTRHHTLSQP